MVNILVHWLALCRLGIRRKGIQQPLNGAPVQVDDRFVHSQKSVSNLFSFIYFVLVFKIVFSLSKASVQWLYRVNIPGLWCLRMSARAPFDLLPFACFRCEREGASHGESKSITAAGDTQRSGSVGFVERSQWSCTCCRVGRGGPGRNSENSVP